MKKAIYRVLMMDEKEEVLKRAASEISKNNHHLVNGVEWSIELSTLLVTCEKDGNNNWVISKDTLNSLASYTRTQFDLILSDYGFVADQTEMDKLNKKIATGYEVKEEDFNKFLLFPKDIKKRFEELNNSNIPYSQNPGIENWFLGHGAPVYIYTYTDANFEQFLPINSSGDVESELKEVFPKSRKIKYILTWSELFNRKEFEKINKDNPSYYPFLISKYLNLLILKELLKKVTYEQRFLAFKNYRKAIFWLVLIGVIAGALSEITGKMTVKAYLELWQHETGSTPLFEKIGELAAFIALMLVIVIGVAIALWYVTENIMKRLINIDKEK